MATNRVEGYQMRSSDDELQNALLPITVFPSQYTAIRAISEMGILGHTPRNLNT